MAKKKKDKMKVIDAGKAESPVYSTDAEVQSEFAEAQKLGGGSVRLSRKLREHHSKSPKLSGGDVDAAWDGADAGEETVSGSSPTPDQAIVEELGEAVGVTYENNEPLGTEKKLEQRDRKRWDLDPASSEDYLDRVKPPDEED